MVISMERWNGKVAVVTGASAGIGAAIAEHLVKHGMKVIGLARRVMLIEENAKKLKGEKGSLHGLKVDLRNPDDITNAFKVIEENYGPVHVLVNNAGSIEFTTLSDGEVEDWKKTIDLNVIGLCVATRDAVRSMKKNNIDGHIIHINSIIGHYPIQCPGVNVYSASKYAVTALTNDLRMELVDAGTKIKVTSISPDLVVTDLAKRFHGDAMDKRASLKPEDIAEAAVYVLSTPPHVQVHEMIIRPVGSTF